MLRAKSAGWLPHTWPAEAAGAAGSMPTAEAEERPTEGDERGCAAAGMMTAGVQEEYDVLRPELCRGDWEVWRRVLQA